MFIFKIKQQKLLDIKQVDLTNLMKVSKIPNGVTDQFTTQNTVKEGTTFEPIIWCAETDRVNEINVRVAVMYGPELEIDMPVFMDDIIAIGELLVFIIIYLFRVDKLLHHVKSTILAKHYGQNCEKRLCVNTTSNVQPI